MKVALKLALIAGLSALLLTLVNNYTGPIIEANKELAKQEAYRDIVDFDSMDILDFDSGIISSQATAYLNDSVNGYVYIGKQKNNFGDVTAMVLITSDGKVGDVKITNYNQTLGNDYVNTNEFLDKFDGPMDDVETVDTKCGATYAATATKDVVQNAILVYKKVVLKEDVEIPTTPDIDENINFSDVEDGTYEGIGTGFGVGLKVGVVVENGACKQVVILGHNETLTTSEPARVTIPEEMVLQNDVNVDTVSGATYTSNGIIQAVKIALTNGKISDSTDLLEIPEEEYVKEPMNIEDGVYTGSHEGYNGLVYVQVTVEDGYITDVQVTEHNEERFQAAVDEIPKEIVKYNKIDVDTVSGSTITSHAIIGAVHNALRKALDVADGTYVGSAMGYISSIKLEVTVEDGYITDITLLESEEQRESEMQEVMHNIIDINSTAVDSIAGATVSSEAVKKAVDNAINQKIDAEDGTYIGSAKGYASDITVELTVEDGYITSCVVTEQAESIPTACTVIPEAIVRENSISVDTVSGNTVTSNAVMEAAKNALGGGAIE